MSSSSLVRNTSHASLHLQHFPQKILSKGQKIRIGWAYKRSLGLERYSHRGVCKSLEIQKFSLSSVVCGIQDRESSQWEREEARWLREEKRWHREEERWLREEARWAAERKDLLEQALISKEEIKALKFEIAQLDSRVKDDKVKDETLSDLIVSLTSLLQSLNMAASLETENQGSSFQAQISTSASTFTEISKALADISSEIPTKSIEMVASLSPPSILELKSAPSTPSYSSERKKRALKRGAEGDDVKAMQEALAKLGFYSGEDDMEYSTFSSGTERAVRSWQATLGASEDGIVTTELLIKLLGEETPKKNASNSPSQVNVTSSAKAAASASNAGAKGPASEVKTVGTVKAAASSSFAGAKGASSDVKVKTSADAGTEKATGLKADSFSPNKSGSNGVEAPQRRVYLLGENRWEEPDRLLSKNGPTVTAAVTKMVGERCFSCKGQGNMVCTECEGSGQLNVEEQFLEWADEDAKCPYCEGKGVLDCDVCAGKGVTTLA